MIAYIYRPKRRHEGKVNDGLHRIKAAIFIGMDDVEVTILK
jgi:hypothetical protein